jgi:hypothetical protein
MTLTHIDKLRNPNFLGSWDLLDKEGNYKNIIVTIKEIKTDEAFNQKSGKKEQIISCLFNECKPMIINATNRKTLKKLCNSSFIEQMTGKRIEITVKKERYFGEMTDCLRILTTAPGQQKQTFDIPTLEAKLKASTTLNELKSNWETLTASEKNIPELLSLKETLKGELL